MKSDEEKQELQELHSRVEQRRENEKKTTSYQLYLMIMDSATKWGMTIAEFGQTVKYLEKTLAKNETAMRKSTAISEVDVFL